MSDELDGLSNEKLSEVFAVEVAGFVKRTEGLLCSKDENRAYIIEGSVLHDVRKKMHLPCDNGILARFATDANAVLPFLEKRTDMACYRTSARDWIVKLGVFSPPGQAPSFARAVCIALIRAARAKAKS